MPQWNNKPLNPVVIILVLFIVFILGLPEILVLPTPCLRPTPLESFIYKECNINQILNKLVTLSLAALAIEIILLSALLNRNKGLFLGLSLVSTGIIIGNFYVSLPRLEGQVNNAPIILTPESFSPK